LHSAMGRGNGVKKSVLQAVGSFEQSHIVSGRLLY
jgi:hypothetical protein